MANDERPTDPERATKPEFSRRGFVSLGTGAVLTLGAAGTAAAQTDGFGKPHPPIVLEDDPDIVVSRPQLAPAAGSPIGAYVAMARSVVATTPGVVVIQHVWGVDAT
ncbi:MAG TPA: hypothetical protein VHT53_08925, partial [Candidatus Elarobacter sp.]|nr:hypothetical protein [Candidatus Elarobacter sp.]